MSTTSSPPYTRLLPALVLAGLASSCAGDGYGLGLTLRGTSAIEDFQLRGYARTNSSANDSRDAQRDDSFLDIDGRSEGRGLGAQIAWMTPIVDVTTGIQTRKYGSEGTTEGTLGLRWRVYDDESATPYLFVEARHTRHESTADEYVNGWAGGFGMLVHMGPHAYVDSSLAWEGTRGLRFPEGDSSHFEIVYQVGVGFAW